MIHPSYIHSIAMWHIPHIYIYIFTCMYIYMWDIYPQLPMTRAICPNYVAFTTSPDSTDRRDRPGSWAPRHRELLQCSGETWLFDGLGEGKPSQSTKTMGRSCVHHYFAGSLFRVDFLLMSATAKFPSCFALCAARVGQFLVLSSGLKSHDFVGWFPLVAGQLSR